MQSSEHSSYLNGEQGQRAVYRKCENQGRSHQAARVGVGVGGWGWGWGGGDMERRVVDVAWSVGCSVEMWEEESAKRTRG